MAIGLSNMGMFSAAFETLPPAAVDALAQLDDAALASVVARAAAWTLTQRSHGGRDGAGDEEDPHQLAATVDPSEATAAALLVCCARERPGQPEQTSTLCQILTDCGVHNEPLAARLAPLLAPHLASVRTVLRATSFDFAQVVDVAWRLDYVLRSSAAGDVHEPLYVVQLKVQPPQGAVRDVAFTCSVEGLRDLVYRLQDATTAIEKIAGVTANPRAATIV